MAGFRAETQQDALARMAAMMRGPGQPLPMQVPGGMVGQLSSAERDMLMQIVRRMRPRIPNFG